MTTPCLQRLRERFPQARISLLTSEKLADLWMNHPSVDALLTFSRSDTPWSVARRLRSRRFDLALVLPNSPRSSLEVWLAGIPKRVGYARPWRSWLLTLPLKLPADRRRPHLRRVGEIKRLIDENHALLPRANEAAFTHQIHDYLYLAAALGANPSALPPKLVVESAEVAAAVEACLSQLQVGAGRGGNSAPPVYLGLNPSAAYGSAKRWPVDYFAEVIRQVSPRVPNSAWIIFGTATDWQLCEHLAATATGRILNLAGKTSLRQLMALLRNCRMLLTNDSGPMHLAAALGTSVIAPFGSTSAELTGPGLPGDERHHVLRTDAPCSPCFRRTCPIDLRCMTAIVPERVTAAVLSAL